jgi:serine/threonine protein kinase
MEKCDGTLDELFVNDEISIENGASYLFQIIMSLLIYQKAFNLTHNDLHTNNIMYTKTDKQFLYYKYAGKSYKVPTYGRILKIIDFGRGIYKYQGKTFCSDSFAPDGDASTQYNMEPFLNKKRPVLEANYSFDLCRLGSSIFDFIMDVDVKVGEMDDLQKTIHRWCMDDNGKNVLYKKNGEERYPSFKLYKMIARTVHAHTPESQLEHPYFNQFFTKESENGSQMVLDIDQIPSYV